MQLCRLPDSCGICGILPNYCPPRCRWEVRGVVPTGVRKTVGGVALNGDVRRYVGAPQGRAFRRLIFRAMPEIRSVTRAI